MLETRFASALIGVFFAGALTFMSGFIPALFLQPKGGMLDSWEGWLAAVGGSCCLLAMGSALATISLLAFRHALTGQPWDTTA